ncbi:MAG: Spy/CpxP family protein refolding chaperone [Isosphaeraceae bacterium]
MMRRFSKWVVTVGAIALMASPALAQRGGGRGFAGGGFGGGVMLLSNKSVQEALKLDDAQTEKVAKIAEETRGKMRDAFQDSQNLSQDERREKMQSITEGVQKSLTDVLKPEQVKRFKQIELQQRGADALTAPAVQSKLNLTDDQKGKLKDIQEDARKQMEGLRGDSDGDRQAAMEKFRTIRKESQDKSFAVLTDEQKASWKELTGEPVEIQFERRRPAQ